MTAWTPTLDAACAPRASHRVVIVGGGFAGLQAARAVSRHHVDVTLVDRRNFHLFAPLVYQVATGSLGPSEVAVPLRPLFRRRPNVRVLLAEVTGIDLEDRRVLLQTTGVGGGRAELPYDSLVVAAGSRYSYFGHDEWRPHAPALKTLESALDIRRRILGAFEAAEAEPDPEQRAALLTFVVVGGGPTGVELAGQVAEIARDTLRRDFRSIDPRTARVLLVEAGGRMLGAMRPSLSEKAARQLRGLGVTPLAGRMVTHVDAASVVLSGAGAPQRVATRTVIWAAGVEASPLGASLGARRDAAGRVLVDPDLTLPGHPEVRVLGDMARIVGTDGRQVALPGTAPVAMQDQGRAPVRRARLAALARDPPVVPHRLPAPPGHAHPVVLELPDPRARLPPDHRRGGRRSRPGPGAGPGARSRPVPAGPRRSPVRPTLPLPPRPA